MSALRFRRRSGYADGWRAGDRQLRIKSSQCIGGFRVTPPRALLFVGSIHWPRLETCGKTPPPKLQGPIQHSRVSHAPLCSTRRAMRAVSSGPSLHCPNVASASCSECSQATGQTKHSAANSTSILSGTQWPSPQPLNARIIYDGQDLRITPMGQSRPSCLRPDCAAPIGPRAVSFRQKRNGTLAFCFNAFSTRKRFAFVAGEPVSTSLENALIAHSMKKAGRSTRFAVAQLCDRITTSRRTAVSRAQMSRHRAAAGRGSSRLRPRRPGASAGWDRDS